MCVSMCTYTHEYMLWMWCMCHGVYRWSRGNPRYWSNTLPCLRQSLLFFYCVCQASFQGFSCPHLPSCYRKVVITDAGVLLPAFTRMLQFKLRFSYLHGTIFNQGEPSPWGLFLRLISHLFFSWILFNFHRWKQCYLCIKQNVNLLNKSFYSFWIQSVTN